MQDVLPVWDPELEDLSFRFFRLFSRAEYALKARNYIQPKPRRTKAKRPAARKANPVYPDWHGFAGDVANAFDRKVAQDPQLAAAIGALFDGGPKTQVVQLDGKIEWIETSFDRDMRAIACKVILKTIRNNLFHGGKAGPSGWHDPGRTKFLLENGIVVLTALIQCGPDVWEAMVSQ